MRIIAIEGAHGAGKDVLAAGLATALGCERFQHTRPRGVATLWEGACWYATQRAKRYSYEGNSLIVSSRWHWSTSVLSFALASLGRHDEARVLRHLHHAERAAIGDPLVTLVVDAPVSVLVARLAARGETWGEREAAERDAVLELARLRSWRVLDTTRSREAVLAEALGIVREVLS